MTTRQLWFVLAFLSLATLGIGGYTVAAGDEVVSAASLHSPVRGKIVYAETAERLQEHINLYLERLPMGEGCEVEVDYGVVADLSVVQYSALISVAYCQGLDQQTGEPWDG